MFLQTYELHKRIQIKKKIFYLKLRCFFTTYLSRNSKCRFFMHVRIDARIIIIIIIILDKTSNNKNGNSIKNIEIYNNHNICFSTRAI